jgi:hypothetical protein
MKTLKILAAIGVLSLMANSQSMAMARTDITLTEGLPDLTGSFMDVSYDAGSSVFLASGWTTDYNISDGNGGAIDVGVSQVDSYILSATINNARNLTGGTLTINGAVNGDGNETAVPLLTANLVTGSAGIAFGYGDGGNELFQFRFIVSGGTLADDFGGNGTAGGIILNASFSGNAGDDNPFTGLWSSSFDNLSDGAAYTGNGDINCFSVPEPTTAGCFLLGLGAWACFRRVSKKRHS